MHGPLKRGGAVACLEGLRTPSLVARKVMDETDQSYEGLGAKPMAYALCTEAGLATLPMEALFPGSLEG